MSKKHRIAVIPGDGIGKEVMPEGVRVLDAAARLEAANGQAEQLSRSLSAAGLARVALAMVPVVGGAAGNVARLAPPALPLRGSR